MKSSTEIEKLCAYGCNVTINYADYPNESLEKFASLVTRGKGILTIKNCSKAPAMALDKLAYIGREHITLDFTL